MSADKERATFREETMTKSVKAVVKARRMMNDKGEGKLRKARTKRLPNY